MFIPFILYYVFIASYFAWWGGWTYGPRLLLAMVLILLYQTVMHYSKHGFPKGVFYGLTGIGLIIIVLAKGTIAYSAPTGIKNPFFELVLGGMAKGIYNPNNVMTMAFGTHPGISLLLFIIVFTFGFYGLTKWYKKWETR